MKALLKLLADLGLPGYHKVEVALDRCFFSAANINGLYSHHLKFLPAVGPPLKLAETHLGPVREKMRGWEHYHPGYQLYAYSLPITWDHVLERPCKGDTVTAGRRMYLHLYYSPGRALEEEKTLHSRLVEWRRELLGGQPHPVHGPQYARYFEVKSITVRGVKVVVKGAAPAEARRNYGYSPCWATISSSPWKR